MLYIIGQIHILMYWSYIYVKVKIGKMASGNVFLKNIFGLDHRVHVCFCKVVCWSQFDHWMFAGACRFCMVVLLTVSWEYNRGSNLLWTGLCWLETQSGCALMTDAPWLQLDTLWNSALIFSCKGQSIGGGIANAASYIVVSLSDVPYTGMWLPFLTSSKNSHYCVYYIIYSKI